MSTDKYVTQNASSVKTNVDESPRSVGGKVQTMPFSFEKVAGDVDASVLRVCGPFSPEIIPLSLKLGCDAIVGLTEVDIGFYTAGEGGAAQDADLLKDGLDPHAGISTLTEQYAPTLADVGKTAYQMITVSGTNPQLMPALDLALTFNTGGANIGTICGVFEYLTK